MWPVRCALGRAVRERGQEAGLLRGWPARWHVIWGKVDECAGTALKYVVVFSGASVHRRATQSHYLPAIRACWVLLHNTG
jgi:hypothetical protein